MTNVGRADAVTRYVIGILLVVAVSHPDLGWRFEAWANCTYALIAVAVVLVATAVSHICPAYWVFGVNTCEKEPFRTSRDQP
jgi:Protein of unknown function (DUF2892)